MKGYNEDEEFSQPHKHEKLLIFFCFLATALIGYLLTHFVALMGA